MEPGRGRGGVRGRGTVGGRGRGGRGRGGRGGLGRGKPVFKKSASTDPRVNSEVQIFVEGLPPSSKIPELVQYFSTVGDIKMDRDSKKPRVWLYTDKVTGQPTGEATITYSSPDTQKMALYTYHHQQFQGNMIRVTPSIVKPHMATIPLLNRGRGRGAGRGWGGGRGRGGGGGKIRTGDNSCRGASRDGWNSSYHGRKEIGSGYGSDGSYGSRRGGGGYGNHGRGGYGGGDGRVMMGNYSYGGGMSSGFPSYDHRARSDVSSRTFRGGATDHPPSLFSVNFGFQTGQYPARSGGGSGPMSMRNQRYQPY